MHEGRYWFNPEHCLLNDQVILVLEACRLALKRFTLALGFDCVVPLLCLDVLVCQQTKRVPVAVLSRPHINYCRVALAVLVDQLVQTLVGALIRVLTLTVFDCSSCSPYL